MAVGDNTFYQYRVLFGIKTASSDVFKYDN